MKGMKGFLFIVFLGFWAVVSAHAADDVFGLVESSLSRNPMVGDQAFLLGQGRRLRGLPPLAMKAQDRILKYKDKYPVSLEYQLWKMRNKDIALLKPVTDVHEPSADFDAVKARALHLPGQGMQQLYAQEAQEVGLNIVRAFSCSSSIGISVGDPSYEYSSTHQVLALLLAYRRGCLQGRKFGTVLQPYVSRVYAELMATKNESLSDVYVERMAILCLVGHCRDRPDDMCTRLQAAQGKDGLWRLEDVFVPQVMSYEHGSALAYFALAAKSRDH